MIKTLISKILGNRESIVIYALIAAVAALYAWGATASADRDAMAAWAQKTCAAAGVQFPEPGEAKRGEACTIAVLVLVKLNHDADMATAKTLAEALTDQQRMASADISAAAKQMQSAAEAVKNMETENAKIDHTDRVGSDWFRALNELGGLREPASR